MRQKLSEYKCALRRQQITLIFRNRRQQLIGTRSSTASNLQIEQPMVLSSQSSTQMMSQQEHATLLSQQHQIINFQHQTILKALQVDNYNSILSALTDIHRCQQEILKRSYNVNNFKKEFIKLLPTLFQVINTAHRIKLTISILQKLSKKCVQIIYHIVRWDELSEQDYLNSAILHFLFVCSQQPRMNQQHISKIVVMTTDLLSVSNSTHLYHILKTVSSQSYNFTMLLHCIQSLKPHPSSNLSINFIIFIKNYMIYLSDHGLKSTFTKNQLDLCFAIANTSFNHFIQIEFQNQQQNHALQQALCAMRYLIEGNLIKLNRFQINFHRMIDTLTIRNCPEEVTSEILIIIDDLIYKDDDFSSKHSVTFVIEYDLLRVLWSLVNAHRKYVLNIFSNLALREQLKDKIRDYVNHIFLMYNFNSSNIEYYHFIYNWFHSQDFQVQDSKDRLIITLLNNSNQTNPKIIQIECLIWFRLFEAGWKCIPRRIMQFDDQKCVIELKKCLDVELC